MRFHRAAVIVVLALAAPAPVAAQPAPPPRVVGAPSADPADPSSALALGEEGLRRFQGARWQDAYDLFRRANEAGHAPTLVLYMAHCQVRLGDLAAGYRLYRSVARERLPEDAPFQFRTAQRIAGQEMRALEPRLGSAKIVIAGVPEGKVRVLVDGAEIPAAELEDVPLEPGDHVVEASTSAGQSLRRTVTAAHGKPAALVLTFEPRLAPPPPAAVAPTAPEPPVAPPSIWRSPFVQGAAVAFGAGGVALLTSLVTGTVSIGVAGDVKSRCVAGHCRTYDQASAAYAGRLADASTATLVVGAFAVATGVVLLVVKPRAPSAPSASGLRIDRGRAVVRGSF